MKDVAIVSGVRTPFGRAIKGSLKDTRPDTMAQLVIEEAVKRSGVDKAEIDDVVLGCAMPEAEQGMNVARVAALAAGLPVEASAMTVNRFCSSACSRSRSWPTASPPAPTPSVSPVASRPCRWFPWAATSRP
jgi:acetyl-CoA acyltransferase